MPLVDTAYELRAGPEGPDFPSLAVVSSCIKVTIMLKKLSSFSVQSMWITKV